MTIDQFLERLGLTADQALLGLALLLAALIVAMIALVAIVVYLDPKRFMSGCMTMAAGLAGGITGAVALMVLTLVCAVMMWVLFGVGVVKVLQR